MDALIVLVIVYVVAVIRMKATGGAYVGKQPVMNSAGDIDYLVDDNIPVGNNLLLNREKEPFMYIVKQLGLVK